MHFQASNNMPTTSPFPSKQSYKKNPSKGENNKLPSLTVQNDSLTISEIIRRYANGIPVQFKQSQYLDVQDIQSINRFYSPAIDLTDLDTLNEQIGHLNDAVNALQKQKDAITSPSEPQQESADGTP